MLLFFDLVQQRIYPRRFLFDGIADEVKRRSRVRSPELERMARYESLSTASSSGPLFVAARP